MRCPEVIEIVFINVRLIPIFFIRGKYADMRCPGVLEIVLLTKKYSENKSEEFQSPRMVPVNRVSTGMSRNVLESAMSCPIGIGRIGTAT